MKEEIDGVLRQSPPMKARDLARVLRRDRSELNAFLHKHPEWYCQDGQYQWSLNAGSKLVLPGGWVTADAFEEVFARNPDALDGKFQDFTITFSPGCNPMIDCIARLLALANQLAHTEYRVTLDFSSAKDAMTYLNRLGFFEQLNPKISVLPAWPQESAAEKYRGGSNALVEFGAIDPSSDAENLIGSLTDKFVRQTSKAYEVAAFTIFGELIGNIYEHSLTKLFGFAGLQKYRGNKSQPKHIQAVVSDSGLGIAATLRPALISHYPALYKKFGEGSLQADIGLVKEALAKGRISRYGGANGLGFQSSREQAIKFDAKFSVRQEEFCLMFLYKNGELVSVKENTHVSRLYGTHICFDFLLA